MKNNNCHRRHFTTSYFTLFISVSHFNEQYKYWMLHRSLKRIFQVTYVIFIMFIMMYIAKRRQFIIYCCFIWLVRLNWVWAGRSQSSLFLVSAAGRTQCWAGWSGPPSPSISRWEVDIMKQATHSRKVSGGSQWHSTFLQTTSLLMSTFSSKNTAPIVSLLSASILTSRLFQIRNEADYLYMMDVDSVFHNRFGAESLSQLSAVLHRGYYKVYSSSYIIFIGNQLTS